MSSCHPTVGLVVLETKQYIFLCTNSQFFSGLTTEQVVDPLPLYRDFPDKLLQHKFPQISCISSHPGLITHTHWNNKFPTRQKYFLLYVRDSGLVVDQNKTELCLFFKRDLAPITITLDNDQIMSKSTSMFKVSSLTLNYNGLTEWIVWFLNLTRL
jgi:hypothetical protein